MANLKNITELPLAESADGLNLIVNDNGAAKQIAAHEVGAQADWAEMDENSPAFIKNKPVEEWDLDLTVDVPWDTEASAQGEPVFTAAEGYSYDAFVAKIEAGEVPNVRIIWDIATSETQVDRMCAVHPTIGHIDGANLCVLTMFAVEGPVNIIMSPDGSFTFDP